MGQVPQGEFSRERSGGTDHYTRDGHDYIKSLADEILARFDPGEPRDLRAPALRDRITSAITAWNQQRS